LFHNNAQLRWRDYQLVQEASLMVRKYGEELVADNEREDGDGKYACMDDDAARWLITYLGNPALQSLSSQPKCWTCQSTKERWMPRTVDLGKSKLFLAILTYMYVWHKFEMLTSNSFQPAIEIFN
jgi:hypothetical protein